MPELRSVDRNLLSSSLSKDDSHLPVEPAMVRKVCRLGRFDVDAKILYLPASQEQETMVLLNFLHGTSILAALPQMYIAQVKL